MSQPLDPPPRKAHLRRAIRNLRRAYRTVFALVILVFGGWAILDFVHWQELTTEQRFLSVGFFLAALLAALVLRFVERPIGRELRLARVGEVVPGQIVTISPARRKRALATIAYTFRTAAGATIEDTCPLPRRFPVETLVAGMTIDILCDPRDPENNKPCLALAFVEFGEIAKKKAPGV